MLYFRNNVLIVLIRLWLDPIGKCMCRWRSKILEWSILYAYPHLSLYTSLCSQYPSLWSVSNSSLAPVPQSGSMSSGLGSQFLRGSAGHYPALSHPIAVPSSGSPLYDSTAADLPHDSAQFDTSPHLRLSTPWTPVTPPSL